MTARTLWLSLLVPLLACVLVPAVRAGSGGLPPGTSPVTGPVEVFVHVPADSVSPGGLVGVDVAIVNSSPDHSAHGAQRATLIYADGTRHQLRFPQPLFLEPDSAIIYQLFLVVPEDAALGSARFSFTVFPGYPGSEGQGAPHVARDSDTFEVVAP